MVPTSLKKYLNERNVFFAGSVLFFAFFKWKIVFSYLGNKNKYAPVMFFFPSLTFLLI